MRVISVTHEPTPHLTACAMALEAREEVGTNFREDTAEFDVACVKYVQAMNKTEAKQAVKNCFFYYGKFGWPEDIPTGALQAAYAKVTEEWDW